MQYFSGRLFFPDFLHMFVSSAEQKYIFAMNQPLALPRVEFMHDCLPIFKHLLFSFYFP